MPKTQFDTMISGIDKNNEGMITYPMFVKYVQENTVDRHMAHVRYATGFSLDAAIVLIREPLLLRIRCTDCTLHRVFRVFDRDGNGEVDSKEFGAVLLRDVDLKFEPHLLAQIIDRLDTNQNGSIGFEECFKCILGIGLRDMIKFKDEYALESAQVNPLDNELNKV